MEIPFNMLILPFLGGYVFIRFWNYTRFHVMRSDKDRLIIRASSVGLIAIFVAYSAKLLLAPLLPCETYAFCISEWWSKNVPFEYSGISTAAFWIAATAWYPLNFVFKRGKEIDRAIEEDADPLELLLKRAQDGYIAVSVTTNNDKVYIGFVTHNFNPATPTNNIGILPLQSGFREPEKKRMNLTTNYSQAYEKITEELDEISEKISKLEGKQAEFLRLNSTKESTEFDVDIKNLEKEWENLEKITNRFQVVIPVNQISSISYFDKEIHLKYFPYDSERLIIT